MLWVKAFHIVAVVAWFAGLFYLPRLFVYHCAIHDGDAAGNERFKTMERRLYRAIMTPACLATIGLGSWLWLGYGIGRDGWSHWMHAKLALVTVLVGFHLYCGRLVRAFAQDRSPHTERWYRIFNEVPTLLLIAIVVLVVVKPV